MLSRPSKRAIHGLASGRLSVGFPPSCSRRFSDKSMMVEAVNPRLTPPLPPLSLLPTKMLLRSVLVSTVTATPVLLRPSLKFLTFLHRTSIPLFHPSKNPLIQSLLKFTFYKHFCAGENAKEVNQTISQLKHLGFKGVILTYAREIIVDKSSREEKSRGSAAAEEILPVEEYSDIESWKQGVLETAGLLGDGDVLAIKLTGAGISVLEALSEDRPLPRQMTSAIDEAVIAAVRRGVKIFIDAEQQFVQPGIDRVAIDLMRTYNRDGQCAIYNTYQAYLKSTPHTLRKHMDAAATGNFTLGVKLVHGAYIASEPRDLIHDTKEQTDECYNGISKGLIQQNFSSTAGPSVRLFLATHNRDSTLLAEQLHADRVESGSATIDVQYGQLLGMADGVSCELLQRGGGGTANAPAPEVFKCLTWGPLNDCLSYLLRRAVENRDAVGRSKTERAMVRAEVRRRVGRALLFRN